MKHLLTFRSRWLTRVALVGLMVLMLSVSVFAADWEGAKKAIAAGTEQEVETIDLSAYALPKEEFQDFFWDAHYKNAFPWYLLTYSYRYDINSGLITTFYPYYMSPEKFDRALYEQAVQDILDACIREDMTPLQKVLACHEYLVTHCQYDYSVLEDSEGPEVELGAPQSYAFVEGQEPAILPFAIYENTWAPAYYGYGALVNQRAVCAGYTEAYMELMKRCGIPAIYVRSDAMNHAWNMVQLDGDWYHIDATWNDPSYYGRYNIQGGVSHRYFLLSDEAMLSRNHYDWTYGYPATNTQFDSGAFWDEVDSNIVFPGNDHYFIYRGGGYQFSLSLRDAVSGEETTVLEGQPPVYQGYLYASRGLSFDQGYLYCTDSRNVWRVNPDGSGQRIVYTLPEDQGVLLSCFVEDNVLYLSINNTVEKKLVDATVTLSVDHVHQYIPRKVEATCQTEGCTAYVCACGVQYTVGHTQTVDHRFSSYHSNGDATCTGDGTKTAACDYGCGTVDTVADEGSALGHNCPVVIPLPICTRCGEVAFSDVKEDRWYTGPVEWAIENGITNGMGDGSFGVGQDCTRAQIVTFLWRAQGAPEPSSTQCVFTDVNVGSWYGKAVLWAVENDITNGVSDTEFGTELPCNRASVVTFLWRAEGCPEPASNHNPFEDVNVNAWYGDAVLWAVENGITDGMSATSFGTTTNCNRAQIVTFLYRTLAK